MSVNDRQQIKLEMGCRNSLSSKIKKKYWVKELVTSLVR